MDIDIEEMDERIKRVLDKVDEVVYNPTGYPFNRHGDPYEMGYRDGMMRVEFWLREEFDPIEKEAKKRISQREKEHERQHRIEY